MIDFHTLGSSFYVYTYAYPESMGGAIFYVGKGQGYRIIDHECETRKGGQSEKCAIIRSVWAHGEEVVKRIIAVFDYRREQDAFAYEWAMINMTIAASQLVNRRGGTFQRKQSEQIMAHGQIVVMRKLTQ